jgi:hypothetical protein
MRLSLRTWGGQLWFGAECLAAGIKREYHEIVTENLGGQLWFGAECLAAGIEERVS